MTKLKNPGKKESNAKYKHTPQTHAHDLNRYRLTT